MTLLQQATHLAKLRYAVFGVGDPAYEEDYCKFAVDVDGWLTRLSGQQMISLACGDVTGDELDADFEQWIRQLFFIIKPADDAAQPAIPAVPAQIVEEPEVTPAAGTGCSPPPHQEEEEPRPVPYYESQIEDPEVVLHFDGVSE